MFSISRVGVRTTNEVALLIPNNAVNVSLICVKENSVSIKINKLTVHVIRYFRHGLTVTTD